MPTCGSGAAPVSEFPRVLFVTPVAFNKVTGGGVTFTNLFRGWPKDRLATVHCDTVPTSDEVCDRYYRLGAEEIALAPWLRAFASATAPDAAGTPAAPAAATPAQRVKRLLFADGAPRRGRLTPTLDSWIDGFRPDVLYTILGGNPVMELVDAIRTRFAVPLVVHFMDDWPSVIYRGGLLSHSERARMQRLLARLVGNAERCLGIGEAMCRAFSERFGREFVPFQNPVEVGRWPSARTGRDPDAPVTIVYTGSVYADAQADSLIAVAEAVARLAAEGVAVRLDIHAPSFQLAPFRSRLALPAVRLLAPLEDDADFFARLSSADMLVLPVNFDRRSVDFIRYSMPTKVPAYLASGTPVLVFGPAGVAQVDYARAAGWGKEVSVPEQRSLQAAIREVATDGALRARLVAAARQTLPAHDAAEVRPRFQKVLIDAARAA